MRGRLIKDLEKEESHQLSLCEPPGGNSAEKPALCAELGLSVMRCGV